MDCYRHPGTAAAATCIACGQPVCPECRQEVAGHLMCQPCVSAAEARLAPPEAPWLPSAGQAAAPATAPAGVLIMPAGAVAAGLAATPSAGVFPQTPGGHVAQTMAADRPGAAQRIVRGLLWGMAYGQVWTVLTIFWDLVWGAARGGSGFGFGWVAGAVFITVVFAFFGSLTGLIIAASNATISTGAAVGIGAGLLLCLLEALATHNFGGMLNVFFYFFTGRFVGANIALRVQRPV